MTQNNIFQVSFWVSEREIRVFVVRSNYLGNIFFFINRDIKLQKLKEDLFYFKQKLVPREIKFLLVPNYYTMKLFTHLVFDKDLGRCLIILVSNVFDLGIL